LPSDCAVECYVSPMAREMRMYLFLLRTLLLASGLLVALPPGWCCMVRSVASPQVPKRDTPTPKSCCDCCKEPAKPQTPEPRPLPHEPGKCPCGEHHSTAPDAPKALSLDLSLPTPSTMIDLTPFWFDGRAVSSVVSPFDLSFRILHCVWLC
jgi:hypothetical protein